GEAAPAPLALAVHARLLGRVALDRLGRDLVDVREDRLAEVVDGVRRQPAGRGRVDDAPPGDARADAVRGQQRVEAAAGPGLTAPEADVHVAGPVGGRGVRLLKGVDETAQRHVVATTAIAPERAGERARGFGPLGAD